MVSLAILSEYSFGARINMGMLWRRFNSQVFLLRVGKQETFHAHVSVLSQSPVLARFCEAPFAENLDGVIEFPDDDPACFARMLEYLYARDYSFIPYTSNMNHPTALIGLARMYILGDKYQLPHLKEITVEKMGKYISSVSSVVKVAFICMADRVYNNTPESDRPFKDFFTKELAIHFISRRDEIPEPLIEEVIYRGGKLASDVFPARCLI